MTKIAFFNIPFHAHINPTLAVVQELVARGDEVVYYLTEKYKPAIEATGATFHSYQSMLEQSDSDFQQQSHPLSLPMLMVDECLFVMPQLLESVRAEQPDCIVYNPMCLSGRFIAQMLHIPAVISRAFFAPHEQTLRSFKLNEREMDVEGKKKLQKSMEQLCMLYPLQPFDIVNIFLHKEALNIVYIPRSFQPYGESFGEEYLFVGPSVGLRCETADFVFDQLSEQPVIYVTSGTVFNNSPDFFKACFAAFADQPWQVVMATGKPAEHLNLGPIPNNFQVRTYVPQLEVLQHTDVSVSHAGMATIMESIFRGVPMVVIPQAANQEPNAKRVAELGLGIRLEKGSVTAKSLRNAVTIILSDPTFRIRVQQMRENTDLSQGFLAAADALEKFVKNPPEQVAG